MNAFKITYDQLLEEGLTLTVKYPDGKNEYASDKRTFGKIQGYYADAVSRCNRFWKAVS